MSHDDALDPAPETDSDTARYGAPEHAASDSQNIAGSSRTEEDAARRGAPRRDAHPLKNGEDARVTEHDAVRHSRTDLDIYEHPYVKKLEERVEKAEARYEAQVRRTEEIQLRGQNALIELQRMVAVGQSQTLADFMLKARELVLGQTDDKREEGGRVDNSRA